MARYIDADKLRGRLYEADFHTPDERRRPESEFAELIDTTPTADVVEVKHGEWINTGSCQVCSICDEEQYGFDNGRKYCPHCGAKMDGGKTE